MHPNTASFSVFTHLCTTLLSGLQRVSPSRSSCHRPSLLGGMILVNPHMIGSTACTWHPLPAPAGTFPKAKSKKKKKKKACGRTGAGSHRSLKRAGSLNRLIRDWHITNWQETESCQWQQLKGCENSFRKVIHLRVWQKVFAVLSQLSLRFLVQTKWEGCKRETSKSQHRKL